MLPSGVMLRATRSIARIYGARLASTTAKPEPVSWKVDPSTPDHLDLAAQSILTHGFVVLEGLLSPASLDALQAPLLERTSRVFADLDAKGVRLEVGSAKGFHEVVLRSPGRWDLPCTPDIVPKVVHEACESIARQLLLPRDEDGSSQTSPCADGQPPVVIAFNGLVRANPGCPQQLWHADSPHLVAHHARPHLLNVLIPLADVSEADGPTEMLPGSHVLTNHMRSGAGFGETTLLYQHEGNCPELIGSSEASVRVPL